MTACMHRTLAALALVAGALAALAGEPQPPLAEDEVSALQLAGWIRERRAGLVLLDVRAGVGALHDTLPGARAAVAVDDATMRAADLLVAFDAHGVDRSTVDALRRRAHPQTVLRVRGGLAAWHADVLFPSLRADASPRQRQSFKVRAVLSRYFGGSPRIVEPGASHARGRSRRGC